MNLPKELKKLLSCSLCCRSYDADNATRLPKELSCRHSYCAGCVEQLAGCLAVACPQCGEQTPLPALGELPTNEGLFFLLKQLPALELGMTMLEQQSKQRLQHTSSNLATTSWANWMDELNVEHFLLAGNDSCLLHATPITTWCHNCQQLLCDACALFGEHSEHQLTQQLDLTELLRQLFCNELDKMEQTIAQASALASSDLTLLRRLCDACETVQQHIRRQIVQHGPTLRSCHMHSWWLCTRQLLQCGILPTGLTAGALLRLLRQLHGQYVKCHSQLLDIYHECRMRASVKEGGLQLLDFEQLHRRLLALRHQPLDATPVTVEPPPALLLTNYCVYEYWSEMQRQL